MDVHDFAGATVSTGTNGPIVESLILASGAAITFTGAYATVGVFYTQQSGAGSLAFQYNVGTAFGTTNAAGATELDRYAGHATGQTASGTYTITASGGPVEITGLVRLGVKTAGSAPRLLTARHAHGSYSFGSFNATARAAASRGRLGLQPEHLSRRGADQRFTARERAHRGGV
jgi:hypothetical protein